MKNKVTGSARNFSWKECDECGNKTRKARIYKGKSFLCFKCYRKKMNIMPPYYKGETLENALNKIREVRCTTTTSPQGVLNLPRVLVGRKVKLILVDGK